MCLKSFNNIYFRIPKNAAKYIRAPTKIKRKIFGLYTSNCVIPIYIRPAPNTDMHIVSKIFPLQLQFNTAVWKKYLKMSWPLALIGLFGVVYTFTDSVMLGYWNLFEETGWYNAAQKIALAGLIPMGLIGASFFPALSKVSKDAKKRISESLE